MAEIITCPGCQRTLQVPEQFLGQTVQCPECRHMFTASSSAVSSTPAVPPVSLDKSAAKPRRRDVDDDYEEPIRRRSRYEDDADDIDLRRRQPFDRDFSPHRGSIVLTLGLISLVGGMSIVVPVILGPVAWALGTYDLREMREGRMDPTGESMTRTGQILGIIATLFLILGVGLIFLLCSGEF